MMFKLPSLIKRKRYPSLVKLIDIPERDISDMDIMTYITYLWEYKDMHHIGYIISKANERHGNRWVLYSLSDKRIEEYFRDRCPAIVEEEILSISNNRDITNHLSKAATGLYNGGIPIVKPIQYWGEDCLRIDWDKDVNYALINDVINM
mgnify:FL=1